MAAGGGRPASAAYLPDMRQETGPAGAASVPILSGRDAAYIFLAEKS